MYRIPVWAPCVYYSCLCTVCVLFLYVHCVCCYTFTDERKRGGNCELPSTKDSSWVPPTDEDWDEEVKSEGTPVAEFQFSGTTSSTMSLKDTTSSRDYRPQQTRPHSNQPQKKVHFSEQQTKAQSIPQHERQNKGGLSKQYTQHKWSEPLRPPHGVKRCVRVPSHVEIVACMYVCTVEPLLKDSLNKIHHKNYLPTKDAF